MGKHKHRIRCFVIMMSAATHDPVLLLVQISLQNGVWSILWWPKSKVWLRVLSYRQMHLTFAATKSISSDQTANSSDSTTKQSILISADIWCLLIVEWQRRNTERVVRKQPKTMLTKNTKRTLSYHLNRIFNRCHSTKQSKPIAIASLQKANKQTRK